MASPKPPLILLRASAGRLITSLSSKLSVAAVMGIGLLPLLPQQSASSAGARDALVEIVRSRSVPVAETPTIGRPHSLVQLAARRSRDKDDSAQEREESPRRRGDRTREKSSRKSAPPPPEVSAPKLGDPAPVAGDDAKAEKANPPPAAAPAAPSPAVATASDPRDSKAPSKPDAKPDPKAPAKPDPKADPKATDPIPSGTADTEPPKPDVWTEEQVITALRECVRVLAPIAAEVEVSQPVKREQCGTPAPIMLKRIGSGANRVEISPPAMINCNMVVSLHSFVEKTLQPAAQEMLGSPIVRLRNASGYNCRTRIGSHQHSEKLSEHAFANAIDIAGFVTADGRTIEVSRFWGPTARDEHEAARVAAARAKDEPATAAKGGKTEPAHKITMRERVVSGIAVRAKDRAKLLQTAELQKLGRGAPEPLDDTKADAKSGSKRDSKLAKPKQKPDAKTLPVPASASAPADVRKTTEAAFLRRLHKGACGTFGTVLGPEANEAHRDHFHFDLAARKRSAFCQ